MTGILILLLAFLFFLIYYLINIGNKYVNEDKRIKINVRKVFFVLIFITFIYLIYKILNKYSFLSNLFGMFIFSVIMAYLFNPIVNFFEKRKIRRSLGILIVYAIILGVIVILSLTIIPNITKEAKKLMEILPLYLNRIFDFLNNIYDRYYSSIYSLPPQLQGVEQAVMGNAENMGNILSENIKKITSSMMDIFPKITSIILVPIFTFYLILDKDSIKNKIYITVPKDKRQDFSRLSKEIDKALGEFIRGRVIVAIFIGVSTTIALLILKIPFGLVIGLIAGIADIIPYFGPVIGIIPAVIFALLDSPLKALWVIIIFTVIQQIENDLITPKIIGESIGIHPITVIVSLIIGGEIMGIWGMVLAVPAVAVGKIVFSFFMEKLNKNQIIDK
ncbi:MULTISPECIES: AI-2E family transporter [Tissierellales]|jgi:sporulation integral membrane protein YtvI|uniref:AI-2E family transporter n=1 Tax=Acidilutibacter cellobiosedens TaxID=2507161 RepID=A0A410QDT0_9FIRM|nr:MULTISPECIES: AI-2E family transporter [Tissierellales]QAT62044.1 AI-2E family transporter [Acidilutibacter cellobiosedens]SCL84933.1 Transport of quorum-sensing signal protein [Sporanaerobacter sp. PP17-6a]